MRRLLEESAANKESFPQLLFVARDSFGDRSGVPLVVRPSGIDAMFGRQAS